MNVFSKYFLDFIWHARNRQKLYVVAMFGLALSSFALIVLLSIMGGLQNGLITRSKNVLGKHTVYLQNYSHKDVLKVKDFLDEKNIISTPELEIELLLRKGNYISPAIVHGVIQDKYLPDFLKAVDLDGMVLATDLSYKLRVDPLEKIKLITPGHTDQFFGELPRMATNYVTDIIRTDVPEVDIVHAWVPIRFLQNLIREKKMNRIRIYSDVNFENLQDSLMNKFGKYVTLQSWESENTTLMWALSLENTVMIFLFVSMSFLISIAVVSSLYILFGKIKFDLTSFWILGKSLDSIDKDTSRFLMLINALAVFFGFICGIGTLFLLQKYSPIMMPDVFIERTLPVSITFKSIVISLLLPFVISTFFTSKVLKKFKSKNRDYLKLVRSVGN